MELSLISIAVSCINYSSNSGVANSDLDMVEAKEAGEIPETTRSFGQTLQTSVWRQEGDLNYATRSKNTFVWIGPTPGVNIMNPDQLKEIFYRNDDFHKPRMNPLVRYLLCGLSDNPAFHLDKLKLMLAKFYRVCDEMISKWEKLVAVEGSCEMNVWPYLLSLTGDVISRTVFGSNFEEGRKIFQLQAELAHITTQVLQSVYIPGWSFLPTQKNRKIKEIDGEIRGLLKGIIKNREKAKNDL